MRHFIVFKSLRRHPDVISRLCFNEIAACSLQQHPLNHNVSLDGERQRGNHVYENAAALNRLSDSDTLYALTNSVVSLESKATEMKDSTGQTG